MYMSSLYVHVHVTAIEWDCNVLYSKMVTNITQTMAIPGGYIRSHNWFQNRTKSTTTQHAPTRLSSLLVNAGSRLARLAIDAPPALHSGNDARLFREPRPPGWELGPGNVGKWACSVLRFSHSSIITSWTEEASSSPIASFLPPEASSLWPPMCRKRSLNFSRLAFSL